MFIFKKSLIGILTLVLGFSMTIPANAAVTDCLLPSSSGAQIVICAGQIGTAPTSATVKKYTPGHYITIGGGDVKKLDDSQTDLTDGLAFATELKNSGVKGVVVRYLWKDLEPTMDKYNFTRIKQHLDLLQSVGLKMVIFIDDKAFSGPTPLPSYLMANSDYYFINTLGAHSATRWNPYVLTRFNSLFTKMGAQFDSHPALEGVTYQETSSQLSASTVTVPPYDPVLYKETIIRTLTNQATAFPKSNVFWMMNFIGSGYHNGVFMKNPESQALIRDIANATMPLGVIMGGPDILPEETSLITRTYPFYKEFSAKGMKLFGSAQNDSFRELHSTSTGSAVYPTRFWTPLEIFQYGRDELHINYLFWNYKTWLSKTTDAKYRGVGEYVWADAIPVIKANPVFNPTTPQRFTEGQRVQTNASGVNIRSTSTLSILGTQDINRPGTIVLDSYRYDISSTPMINNQWWKVNFDTGVDGLINDAFISNLGGGTNSLPDVVVTSLNYNQTTHNFTSVVKNQGTTATPANTVIGVGYSVDGVQQTWGNVNSPIAAGASVTIGTNSTGLTAGPYTIPAGVHSIRAWADDVNRFAETNENNNQLTQSITISGNQANVPPTISGTPVTTVAKNTAYNFIPNAIDANGNVLTFAIVNKPAWATFNTITGKLSGTPTVVGTHSNIKISVTDGNSPAVFLPTFNINVTNTIPPIVGQKYNPGHYVTLTQKDSLMLDDSPTKNNDGPVFVQKLKDDGVKGLVVRYPWKQFETTQGNYNYTRVNKHLDLLQSKGLKMVVFVDDKSFSGEATVPDYIKNNSNYIFPNKTGGYSATRWNPFVKSRFIALWTDMGANLDDHPALEGVVYSETSLSIPAGTVTVPQYDPVVHKQLIIDTLTAQSVAFPKSNVFWMMNFIGNGYHDGQFLGNAIVDTYIGDIADTVLPLGVIMGGPDILPEEEGLVNRTYPYYDEFNAKGMKLFCSAQNDSFRHLHNGNTTLPFYTPLQILNYAKNELHVNYVWWNYKTWTDPGVLNKDGVPIPVGEYVWNDAVTIIKANPNFDPN